MDNNLDSLFGAMADPTRRAVIARLTRGPAAVSDLHAPFDMALPSFLKHLTKLEAAGLIRTSKQGRTRIAQIETARLRIAEDWLSQQRTLWESRLDRLSALAEQIEKDQT